MSEHVDERYLGLWAEEGKSDWSALLSFDESVPTFDVGLERPTVHYGGWYETMELSSHKDKATALRLAAEALELMARNYLCIAAGLRGDPDTDAAGGE